MRRPLEATARRVAEILERVEKHRAPESIEAFRAVAARLDRFTATWLRCPGHRGLWNLHRPAHLDLHARHGHKIDEAFSQLSAHPPNR